MLGEISIREFFEWRAYSDIEPFDATRADYRAASIVRAILNVNRPKGKAPVKLKDCVLEFGEPAPPPKPTPEQARAQILATMETLMKIYNKPPKKRAPRKRA